MEHLSLDDSGNEGTDGQVSLAEDEVIDFITGNPVKLKGNEEVRQRIARGLYFEYGIRVRTWSGISPSRCPRPASGDTTKRADIAIFEPGAEHTLANLRRVVICKPAPKGGRAVTKIRTYRAGGARISPSSDPARARTRPRRSSTACGRTGSTSSSCRRTVKDGFSATFEPRANWPLADESIQAGTVASVSRLRRGEAAMLKTAFRRCHNYIHGNEGMPKDAAFWQFLYLLFAKMHDERENLRTGRAPAVLTCSPPSRSPTKAGRRSAERIEALFAEVKNEYELFTARDELTLSDRALAFIVGEIAPYNLTGTDADVKGIAYQELVGDQLARRPRPVLHASGRGQAHGGHPRPEGGRDRSRPRLRYRGLPPGDSPPSPREVARGRAARPAFPTPRNS